MLKGSLFLIVALLFATLLLEATNSKQLNCYQIDTTLLQSGDLVFRKGYGLASDIALNASTNEKRFSHVGIFYQENGKDYVIHSIDDKMKLFNGVTKEPLENFVEDGNYFGAYRIISNDKTIKKFINEAILLLEANISYDNNYDHTNPTKLYCSEFIYVLVNSILGQDIIPTTIYHGKEIISIENIYENELFFKKIF